MKPTKTKVIMEQVGEHIYITGEAHTPIEPIPVNEVKEAADRRMGWHISFMLVVLLVAFAIAFGSYLAYLVSEHLDKQADERFMWEVEQIPLHHVE